MEHMRSTWQDDLGREITEDQWWAALLQIHSSSGGINYANLGLILQQRWANYGLHCLIRPTRHLHRQQSYNISKLVFFVSQFFSCDTSLVPPDGTVQLPGHSLMLFHSSSLDLIFMCSSPSAAKWVDEKAENRQWVLHFQQRMGCKIFFHWSTMKGHVSQQNVFRWNTRI